MHICNKGHKCDNENCYHSEPHDVDISCQLICMSSNGDISKRCIDEYIEEDEAEGEDIHE